VLIWWVPVKVSFKPELVFWYPHRLVMAAAGADAVVESPTSRNRRVMPAPADCADTTSVPDHVVVLVPTRPCS